MAREETIVSGVAGRYATALFDLAESENAIAAIEADLDHFAALVAASDDLKRLVRSPVFAADDQIRALKAVADATGLSGLAVNFILLTARKRRLFAILDMIRAYKALAAAHRGEVTAEIRSAEPLNERHAQALRAALKDYAGREITLLTRVDRSLIGGLVVKIGSRMIDASLRTRLNALKIAMKEARA